MNIKINNYNDTLPEELSKKAIEMLKDPYVFDIAYNEKALEKDVENALVSNITDLLLELGNGFAFIGRQYHLEIGGDDYYIDLLFYHLKQLLQYIFYNQNYFHILDIYLK